MILVDNCSPRNYACLFEAIWKTAREIGLSISADKFGEITGSIDLSVFREVLTSPDDLFGLSAVTILSTSSSPTGKKTLTLRLVKNQFSSKSYQVVLV